jgi:hypothetical protein
LEERRERMKRVVIDLDGIAADFSRGWMEHHGVPNPYDDPKRRGDDFWDAVPYTGLTEKQFWAPFGRDFWASLPKTAEADQIINMLFRDFRPNQLCFLTSPCDTDGCLDGKRDWVQKHYPDIPILFSQRAPGKDSPKWMLAGDDTLLIDDHTPNVNNFKAAGGHGFLFPRPWNQAHELEPHALEFLREALNKFVGYGEVACLQ